MESGQPTEQEELLEIRSLYIKVLKMALGSEKPPTASMLKVIHQFLTDNKAERESPRRRSYLEDNLPTFDDDNNIIFPPADQSGAG